MVSFFSIISNIADISIGLPPHHANSVTPNDLTVLTGMGGNSYMIDPPKAPVIKKFNKDDLAGGKQH